MRENACVKALRALLIAEVKRSINILNNNNLPGNIWVSLIISTLWFPHRLEWAC